jgi:hypothetical protein
MGVDPMTGVFGNAYDGRAVKVHAIGFNVPVDPSAPFKFPNLWSHIPEQVPFKTAPDKLDANPVDSKPGPGENQYCCTKQKK